MVDTHHTCSTNFRDAKALSLLRGWINIHLFSTTHAVQQDTDSRVSTSILKISRRCVGDHIDTKSGLAIFMNVPPWNLFYRKSKIWLGKIWIHENSADEIHLSHLFLASRQTIAIKLLHATSIPSALHITSDLLVIFRPEKALQYQGLERWTNTGPVLHPMNRLCLDNIMPAFTDVTVPVHESATKWTGFSNLTWCTSSKLTLFSQNVLPNVLESYQKLLQKFTNLTEEGRLVS